MLERNCHDYMGLNCRAMPGRVRALLWVAALFMALTVGTSGVMAQKDPNDPGMQDFVHVNIHDWGLQVGASSPLKTVLGVDNPLQGVDIWLEIYSVDSGVVRFDSVHFRYESQYSCLVNNPTMIPNRTVNYYSDGVLPDTVNIFMYGVGPDEVYECATYDDWYMYYTGLHAGRVGIRDMGALSGPEQETRFWLAGHPVDGDGDHYGRVYSDWVSVGGGTHNGGGGGEGTDPGNLDVVLVNTDANDYHWSVGLGKSSPVGVTLMWDESITGLEYNFEVRSMTSGDARVDSVVFTDLLLDEQILPNRSVTLAGDGVLPDTIKIVATADSPENYLAASFVSIRTLMFIYLTGVEVGEISIVAFDGTVDTENATKLWPAGQDDWFGPVVVSEAVPVVDGGGIDFLDPGVRDTLHMEGIVLRTTRSTPINVRVVNDEEVRYFTGMFAFETVDSGSVQIDSVVWVGRLADRSVCGERRVEDGLRPDGSPMLMVGAYAPHLEPYGYALPPGDEVVMQVYLTAISPGTIRLDTASSPTVMFRHTSTTFETIDGVHQFCPYFDPVQVIASADQPPTFTQPAEPIPHAAVGQIIEFMVAAEPEKPGNEVELSLRSLNSWDNAHITPSVEPDFSPMSGLFSWIPGYDDVGIWRAVFQATVTQTGAADTATVMLNVVTSPEYRVFFNLVGSKDESVVPIPASGAVHGNFDQDNQQEVVFTPYLAPEGGSIRVFEFDGVNMFAQVSQSDCYHGMFNRGLKAGFFDEDAHLDLALMSENWLFVLSGNGDNTFDEGAPPVLVPGLHWQHADLSNFNGDAFIDYIVLGDRVVHVFPGTATGFAASDSIAVGPEPDDAGDDKTLFTINSADFDGDGWDDLAIGTVAGLWVYINDGEGGYTAGAQYPLDFPPFDISITNAGADFNGDGKYDLCVTLPLNRYYWYSDATRILIYFGNGDGTFTESNVTTVMGLVMASRPGDFNGDGKLDIAFINHGEKYLGVLLGDGTGSFENQLRFPVPLVNPFVIDCLDIDVDGDMDVVVDATGTVAPNVSEHWYYLYVNNGNPAGIIRSNLTLSLQNDASVELVAPNGGRLSLIDNSIPSGEYYRRNLDNNTRLDAVASVGTLQHGRYDVVIKPAAVGQAEGVFSLGYKIGGRSYRLASDLPIGNESYIFPVYPDGNSPVSPPQGVCVRNEHPMFEWDSIAVPGPDKQSSLPITDFKCDFRCGPDPSFDNILESATVSGNRYCLNTALRVADTTTYYWQLRPSGSTEWGAVFAFNALPVSDYVKDPEDRESEDGPNGAGDGPANPGDNDEGLAEAGQEALDLPDTYALRQNHPNPFNPRTNLAYSLPEVSRVKLEVYNILGQLVATLVDQVQAPGEYTVTWDAGDQASGVYLYRLSTDAFVSTKKMLLLK